MGSSCIVWDHVSRYWTGSGSGLLSLNHCIQMWIKLRERHIPFWSTDQSNPLMVHFTVVSLSVIRFWILNKRKEETVNYFVGGCLLISSAHLLRGPAADNGLLLLGAAGRQDGAAGLWSRCPAGLWVSHHPGHIARHDRRAHRRSDGKACERVCLFLVYVRRRWRQ